MMDALFNAVIQAGDRPVKTNWYQGRSDWLVVYGIGFEPHHQARLRQAKRGHTLHIDLGYSNREQNMRICVDVDHPDKWFDRTPEVGKQVKFSDDYDEKGPIILAGLGKKSRRYLRAFDWERVKFKELRREFPNKEIIFRPKGEDMMTLPCRMDRSTPFQELIKGASLVVAKHSNCCIDAIVQGIPFRAEAGAAKAFDGDRQKFMNKLSRWEYPPDRAGEAWRFAKEIVR